MSEPLARLRQRLASLMPEPLEHPVPGAADPDPQGSVVVVDRPSGHIEDEPGSVPDGMRVAAGWAWRILVLGAFVYYLGHVLSALTEVLTPLILALLFTAAFWPLKNALVRAAIPRGLAAAACLLTLPVLVAGIVLLVSMQITTQWTQLSNEAIGSFNQLVGWLRNGPLHITNTQIDGWLTSASNWVKLSQGTIAGYAATVGSQVSRFLAGMALALFAMFYFLYDGHQLARAMSVLVPGRSRIRFMDAAGHGWIALVAYVRAAVIVAAVDGLGALLGAAGIGSSMWLAIGALTFLTAFIPLVGAYISGTVATGVVFVTLGPWRALIMVIVFILVMAIEAHVLQPFLMGKAVSLHPLAVLYGIAIGVIVGGFIGALFTVPFMAFANAFVRAVAASASRLGPAGFGPGRRDGCAIRRRPISHR